MATHPEVADRITHHLAELNQWVTGRKSWTNHYHPDHAVIHVADGQEVLKHAYAVQALVDVASLSEPVLSMVELPPLPS